jgi:hypothetical protein
MKSSINDNDYEITVDMLEQMTDLRVTDGKMMILSTLKKAAVLPRSSVFLGC